MNESRRHTSMLPGLRHKLHILMFLVSALWFSDSSERLWRETHEHPAHKHVIYLVYSHLRSEHSLVAQTRLHAAAQRKFSVASLQIQYFLELSSTFFIFIFSTFPPPLTTVSHSLPRYRSTSSFPASFLWFCFADLTFPVLPLLLSACH
jgi:hypothetical protein